MTKQLYFTKKGANGKKVNLNFVSFKMNESLNLKALCRIIFDPKIPYISGILCKGLTYLLFW